MVFNENQLRLLRRLYMMVQNLTNSKRQDREILDELASQYERLEYLRDQPLEEYSDMVLEEVHQVLDRIKVLVDESLAKQLTELRGTLKQLLALRTDFERSMMDMSLKPEKATIPEAGVLCWSEVVLLSINLADGLGKEISYKSSWLAKSSSTPYQVFQRAWEANPFFDGKMFTLAQEKLELYFKMIEVAK